MCIGIDDKSEPSSGRSGITVRSRCGRVLSCYAAPLELGTNHHQAHDYTHGAPIGA
jgi:hypothetical protein